MMDNFRLLDAVNQQRNIRGAALYLGIAIAVYGAFRIDFDFGVFALGVALAAWAYR